MGWPGKLYSIFDSGCETSLVGAFDGLNDGAVLEDEEGGHCSDAILLRDFLLVVDVDFSKCYAVWLCVFCG